MAADPRRSPDWPTLNAYVDGELDAATHAVVAAAIAADAELAGQVASLARLRAVTAEAFAAEADNVARPPLTAIVMPPRRRWPAIAAGGLFALIAVSLGWLWMERAEDPALAAHRQWASAPTDAVLPAAHHGAFEIPDLADAGLRVAHVAAKGEALHIGYVGNRGCRVTLWVVPDGVARALREERHGDTLIARWSHGGLGYAAIATGMPSARFGVIAAGLERATIRQRHLDDATRLALQAGRDHSAPCLG